MKLKPKTRDTGISLKVDADSDTELTYCDLTCETMALLTLNFCRFMTKVHSKEMCVCVSGLGVVEKKELTTQ